MDLFPWPVPRGSIGGRRFPSYLRRDNDLYCVVDSMLGRVERIRQVGEPKAVRDESRTVDPALCDEGEAAPNRTLSFAANAVKVEVVANQVGRIEWRRLSTKRCEAHLPTPLQHVDAFVQGVGCSGTLDYQVGPPMRQVLHRLHNILTPHVDDGIRAEASPELEPRVACPRQDYSGAQRFGARYGHETDRAGP